MQNSSFNSSFLPKFKNSRPFPGLKVKFLNSSFFPGPVRTWGLFLFHLMESDFRHFLNVYIYAYYQDVETRHVLVSLENVTFNYWFQCKDLMYQMISFHSYTTTSMTALKMFHMYTNYKCKPSNLRIQFENMMRIV